MKNNDLKIASFASKNNEKAYKRYAAKKKGNGITKNDCSYRCISDYRFHDW